MRILKWAGFVVIAVLVLFLTIGFLLPREYSVERSIVIAAPPAAIHEVVGNLEEWPHWQPWQDMDETIQTTLGERTTGAGASQTWTGKDGTGSLEFTSSDPATGIAYEMTMNDGEYASTGSVRYEPAEAGTRVTWSMEGAVGAGNPVHRYFVVLMDAMVGPPFEEGLRRLKSRVESGLSAT